MNLSLHSRTISFGDITKNDKNKNKNERDHITKKKIIKNKKGFLIKTALIIAVFK
jgi:hypothetical protein